MYIGIGYKLPTVWGKYISWMYVLVLDILITSYREILKKMWHQTRRVGGEGGQSGKKDTTEF